MIAALRDGPSGKKHPHLCPEVSVDRDFYLLDPHPSFFRQQLHFWLLRFHLSHAEHSRRALGIAGPTLGKHRLKQNWVARVHLSSTAFLQFS
jgi:hypothetical protein